MWNVENAIWSLPLQILKAGFVEGKGNKSGNIGDIS